MKYARKLAEEKGRQEEFVLYETVEELSKKLIMQHHRRLKPVCANVDFSSGLTDGIVFTFYLVGV